MTFNELANVVIKEISDLPKDVADKAAGECFAPMYVGLIETSTDGSKNCDSEAPEWVVEQVRKTLDTYHKNIRG